MEYICAVDGVYEAAIPICVENVGFDMLGKLLGADGKNMIYIEQCTGVSLSLDGEASVFMNPNPRPGPLRLIVRHNSEHNVKAAIPLVEHLVTTMKTSYNTYMESILQEDPLFKVKRFARVVLGYPHFVQIPLNVEATRDFDIFEPLLGKDGKNLEYIEQCTEAHLSVQGFAARSLRGDVSEGPVRVLIRHKTREGLEETVPLVESLIEVVQEDYKTYLKDVLCGRHTSGPGGGPGKFACELCDLQCQSKEEFDSHCTGALHARNQLTQAIQPKTKGASTAAIPTSYRAGGIPPSDEKLEVELGEQSQTSVPAHERCEEPAYQLKFFTLLLESQATNGYRLWLSRIIVFDEMDPIQAENLKRKARDPNHCLVCAESILSGSYGMHFTTLKHKRNYLNCQLKYGTKVFVEYYGGVPLPGINVKGGRNFAASVCNFRDVEKRPGFNNSFYQEGVILSGGLHNYHCEVCNIQVAKSTWVQHMQGKKHATKCRENLVKFGPYQYLLKFRSTPAPIPSTLNSIKYFIGITEAQLEEAGKTLPAFNSSLWPKLKELADQEREEQRKILRAQAKRPNQDGDDGNIVKKRSREDRLERTLVDRLQMLTNVQDPVIITAALSSMREQNVDLEELLDLLDSDQMKAAIAGEAGSDKFSAVVERLVNFSVE